MKLNALDIRKQEFTRRFRGYDPEEVDGFLQAVAQQWQEQADEIRRLQHRLDDQEAKLGHYQKVESALEEALETAREGARQRIETADLKAASTVAEAERRARAATEEAERRVRTLVSEAETREARAERAVSAAALRRNEIVARLRAFLSSELELLTGFGSLEPEPTAATDGPGGGGLRHVVPPRTAAPTEEPAPDESPAEASVDEEFGAFEFETPDAGPEPDEDAAPVPAAGPEPDEDAAPVPAAGPEADEDVAPALADGMEADVDTARAPAAGMEADEDVAPAPAIGPEADVDTARAPAAGMELDEDAYAGTGRKKPSGRGRRRESDVRQGELMDESKEYSGATDEIRKIRRILEDLDK